MAILGSKLPKWALCTTLVPALCLAAPALAGIGGACGAADAAESEPCGDNTNGGCNSDPDAFGTELVCGGSVAGTAWADGGTRDTDWYLVSVTDGDGDGQATLIASLSSQFPGVVFIIDVGGGDCSTIGIVGDTGFSDAGCAGGTSAVACVTAGDYVVFAACGNPDGSAIFEGYPCGGGANDYLLSVTCADFKDPGNVCDFILPACVGAEGSCAEANGTPGCDDPSCCSVVCDQDPFCCDTEWDQTCADAAFALCGIFVYDCNADENSPPNDCCTTPTLVSVGECLLFDTTDALTDGPGEASCNSAMNDLPIWRDLWYLVEAEVSAPLTLTCCNLAMFDTKIAAYDIGAFADYDCAEILNPETSAIIACNEDCDDAVFFSSELVINALAGNFYLVRIGGYLDEHGPGTICFNQDITEPPANDDCENAIEILDGATDYTTLLATTDGTAHASCEFDGQTYHDIWFHYTPLQDGDVTISTCNTASYDTDLVVYTGCNTADCPPGDGALLGCNDDGPGCAGFSSELTVTVECGQCYTIRVGGWGEGDQGDATLNITPLGGNKCDNECPCLWDLDGDCNVGPSDLANLLASWNTPYGPADLAALLAEWGCSNP